jgi:hydrogenase-1 operon protein HyaF
MAHALLAEVAQLLGHLARTGECGAIDLRGLPMPDADRDAVRQVLGQGEVRVALQAAGRSEIWETRYAGVWWIRHLGERDEVAAEEIAVTPIPALLAAHREDIATAAARIERDLEEASHA